MKLPGVLVVIALAVGAVGCGGGGEEDYSPEVARNFTEECVGSALEAGDGALSEAEATKYCSCTYDAIEANVPFAEFAEYDEQAREDEDTALPPRLEAAAATCGAEQGYTAGVEKTFVAECVGGVVAGGVSEAQAREYCVCTFAEVEAKVPFEEYAEVAAKTRKDPSAEPPAWMAAAAERCVASVG